MKRNIMKEAHKLTKEIKEQYPEVDYQAQLGLCLSFLTQESKKEGEKKMTIINRKKFFNEVNKWDIYKYLENNFTKEIIHHSLDVGKNIYEVRFYLDETKKHIFLHCYHDEDGWRDFDYFVGGLLRFVKESEENKEKATEMFRYFDCVESE